MQAKARYKEAFGRLRTLKSEIEHLHRLLEHNRLRLQHDFELWLTDARERMGVTLPGGATTSGQAQADPTGRRISSQHDTATSLAAPPSPAPSIFPGEDGGAQAVSHADQDSRAPSSGKASDLRSSIRPRSQGADGPQLPAPAQQAPSSRGLDNRDGSMQIPAQQMQHASTGSTKRQQPQQQQQADSTISQGPLPPSRSAPPSGAKNAAVFKLDMSKLQQHASGQQPGPAPKASEPINASISSPVALAPDSKGCSEGGPAASSSQVGSGRDAVGHAGPGQRPATNEVQIAPQVLLSSSTVLQDNVDMGHPLFVPARVALQGALEPRTLVFLFCGSPMSDILNSYLLCCKRRLQAFMEAASLPNVWAEPQP